MNKEIGKFEKYEKMLGMKYGSAWNRLRKIVLYNLVYENNLDSCYVCKGKINSVHELSIEHKEDWLDNKDPVETYFNLNNIAFSHRSCNKSSTSKMYSSTENLEKQKVYFSKKTCGLKGVLYKKSRGHYEIRIPFEGVVKYYGNYTDRSQAAKRADEELIRIFGEDVITNKKMGLY